MCGICGFLKTPALISESNPNNIIRHMNDTLTSRGPDEEGYYTDSAIVLGHKRLKIIDLLGGQQPLYNENQDLVLIFNGEIYNFKDIRSWCESKGHRFRSHTDSECIIHLFEEKGIECIHDLNGMFAFALWNTKTQDLYLVRDRFGKKPLYYSDWNNHFIFASEIKAILQFPHFPKTIDHLAVAKFLALNCIPAPQSPFLHIKQLPGGYYVHHTKESTSVHQYWDNDFRVHHTSLSKKKRIEQLTELFIKSVKQRMISDVPLGAFLSGGIDSSTVVGCMRKLNPDQEIKTFSIGFQDNTFDESPYARLVADHFHTNHHSYIFDTKNIFSLLPEVINYFDTPIGDPALIPGYLLCKAAREHVTVALVGEGNDELMAGYPTYFSYKISKLYNKIPLFIRAHILEHCIKALPVSHSYQPIDFKLKHFIDGAQAHPLHRIQRWIGAFNAPLLNELLLSTNKSTLTDDILYNDITQYFKDKSHFPKEIDMIYQLHLKIYLQEMLLNKVDRISMAHSLEIRCPFLDVHFVEFVNGLPHKDKEQLFKGKRLFKKAFGDLLPKEILQRRKQGLGVPIGQWIKNELRPLYYDVFAAQKIKSDGLFDARFVHMLLDEHTQDKRDNRNLLWALLIIQLWYDTWAR